MNSEWQTMNFVYLAGFLIFILLAFIPRLKSVGFSKSVQMALVWVLIFGGLLLLVGEWPRIRAALDPSQPRMEGVEMRVRAANDGHFYIRGQVNGAPTSFLVDTGASDIVLSPETAERAGLPAESLNFDGVAMTANGPVRIAAARLDSLQIGPVSRSGVVVSVNEGALDQDLLGMSFLNRLSGWRVERGELILTP
ncbi:retropepsin-like aspartic protease family protein [Pacificimonas sp. ICDLI1SI03]